MRIGLGPVFAYEWLRTARNWRVYAFRTLFGLTLLGVLWLVSVSNAESRQYRSLSGIQEQAEAGRAFSAGIVLTQLSLILLVAPAATAGAVCLDKQRGTLAHVLVTDLSSAEVVLGKLAARLLPAIGLVIASMGVTAICTLMGGIDPMGLVGGFLVSLGSAILAGTIALCISVWAGRTHEVLMATYLVLMTWLMAYPVWWALGMAGTVTRPPSWLEPTNPFYLAAEVRPGGVMLDRYALFLLACVGLSVLLAGLATWRIRAVATRQLNGPTRKPRKGRGATERPVKEGRLGFWRSVSRRFSPNLDRNPVLWREWHRRRPSRWSRAIWYAYGALSIGGTALGVWLVAQPGNRGQAEVAMILINGFQVAIGLLLLSVSAATALAEERVRGSLDVLMATPLATRTILWGKWWGAYRTVPFLAILPSVLALAAILTYMPGTLGTVPINARAAQWASPIARLSLRGTGVLLIVGLTLAYGAAITSYGLAMATWIERLDRAVTATVATYVLISVGWMFLIFGIDSADNVNGPGLCSASPFMGIAFTGSLIVDGYGLDDSRWDGQVAWATFWILANLTAAALLMKVTLLSFNRKLGRTPEEGLPRRPIPERVGKPKSPEPVEV